MFWLCFTFTSNVFDLDHCFDFFDRKRVCFDCAPLLFRLCLTYVVTVLDLCFDFLDCFDCTQPMVNCARPLFRLCSTYVLTFSTEIGPYLTVFDL